MYYYSVKFTEKYFPPYDFGSKVLHHGVTIGWCYSVIDATKMTDYSFLQYILSDTNLIGIDTYIFLNTFR